MVLYIAQDVPCEIMLRLDNLQIVNAFNDRPWRYEYDWLWRNDKDMAIHSHGNWTRRVARKASVASGRCTSLVTPRRGKRPLSMINTRN